METWRLIEEGPCDGAYNMAADRALLRVCGEGPATPTLRLYGWERPTLTTGYAQNPAQEVDLETCRVHGIERVSRPTGGRALLHWQELTYSLSAPIPHPRFPSTLMGSFAAISRALLVSLARLGIDHAAVAVPEKASHAEAGSCFASLNHYEIAVAGKKLVGSAQRRTRRAFLQHGSVWIGCDRDRIHSLIRFKDEASRRNHLAVLRQSTVTLTEILGREPSWAETALAFREGFQQAFGVRWQTGGWTRREEELRAGFLRREAELGAGLPAGG